MEERTCGFCKGTFIPKCVPAREVIYCSQTCKWRAGSAKKKAARRARQVERLCLHCQKPFTTPNLKVLTCSPECQRRRLRTKANTLDRQKRMAEVPGLEQKRYRSFLQSLLKKELARVTTGGGKTAQAGYPRQ